MYAHIYIYIWNENSPFKSCFIVLQCHMRIMVYKIIATRLFVVRQFVQVDTKETSKLRKTDLCEGKPPHPVDPSQNASFTTDGRWTLYKRTVMGKAFPFHKCLSPGIKAATNGLYRGQRLINTEFWYFVCCMHKLPVRQTDNMPISNAPPMICLAVMNIPQIHMNNERITAFLNRRVLIQYKDCFYWYMDHQYNDKTVIAAKTNP